MLIKLTQKQNRTIHPNKNRHGSTIHPPLWEEPTLYFKSSIERVFLMVHHMSHILAPAAAASSVLYTAIATTPCLRKLFTSQLSSKPFYIIES